MCRLHVRNEGGAALLSLTFGVRSATATAFNGAATLRAPHQTVAPHENVSGRVRSKSWLLAVPGD